MQKTLTEWQKHLEQHFAALAQARANSGYPLFALEHGLPPDEIRCIKGLLRSRLANDEWLALHWLVWVVYATEFGYEYFGDEYWQSFEEFTPYWREHAKREFLRQWFKRFQQNYSGVEPAGRWAKFCKNIAWPITHAILPRYLQNQFAQALHELRYQLARLDDLSPVAIGRYLRENIWNASSRFLQFLEHEELTGQLALALLSNRSVEGESPIYLPTLDRLVADLEATRNAKEWLSETQRVVTTRIHGARQGGIASARGGKASSTPNVRSSLPNLRPRLMLLPKGPSTWSVRMDIPSFAPLAVTFPHLRHFLATTRCRIVGSWSPAGSLLGATSKRVALPTWPLASAQLLKFEKSNPELEQILATEVRLSDGPNRLFRIGGDGCASEILGKIARLGRPYLILSEGELPASDSFLTPLSITCQGVNLAAINIPASTTADHIRHAQQLGIQLARTVRIWPAGLPAKAWDGDGTSEWLTTDSPCFGLQHDYAVVQSYRIALDDEFLLRIDASPGGIPTFIQLPPLPLGSHRLAVRPVTSGLNVLAAGAEGVVSLEVREPQAWVPGTTQFSGLFVSVDPPSPSLDDVLDGTLAATINGPSGHSVTCTMRLFGKDGQQEPTDITSRHILPVSTADFSRSLTRPFRSDELAWKALESPAGRLVISAEELGQFSLPLDREFKPVRCVCREQRGEMVLRLLEDSSGDEPTTVCFHSYQRPAVSQILNCDLFTGYGVPSPGGLFVVRKGSFTTGLVVSTPRISGGLQGLGGTDLRDFGVTDDTLLAAIELLGLWRGARLAGPLSELRRSRIANAILARIYATFCGERWGHWEEKRRSDTANGDLDLLQQMVGGSSGFAASLRRGYAQIGEATQTGKEWFADVARRYSISSDAGLCEFALQFASAPERLLLPHIRPVLRTLVADIKRHGILMRCARFASILAALEEPATEGILLPRWRW